MSEGITLVHEWGLLWWLPVLFSKVILTSRLILHPLYSVQFGLPWSVLFLDKHVKPQQLIWIGLYIVYIIQKYNMQHLNTIDSHLTPSNGSEIEPFYSAFVKVKIWIFNVVTNLQVTFLFWKLIKNETLKVLQLCSSIPNCLHIPSNVLEMDNSLSNWGINCRETDTVRRHCNTSGWSCKMYHWPEPN